MTFTVSPVAAGMPPGDRPSTPRSAGPAGGAPSDPRAMRRRLFRGFLTTVAIALAIAALLTAVAGGEFAVKLVYSLAIGLSIWVTIDGGRTLTGGLVDRWRARRGLPPAAETSPAARWTIVALLSALALVVGPLAGYAIADRLTGRSTPSPFGFEGSTLILAVTVGGTALSVVLLSLAEKLAAARAQAQAAGRAALEHRLKLLEVQLEPHMLFNTLANLRVLIETEPAAAQAMLDRLIGYLRATLGGSRVAWHPLAEEYARLDDYLALMRVRMGERLAVELDLPADLREAPVPPLLLQPIVENAIRHGLEPKVGAGRLLVRARRAGDALRLEVRDTGVGPEAAREGRTAGGTRFGLEQVRSRLEALYGPAASFALRAAEDAEGGALAVVEMPLLRRSDGR